MNLQPQALFFRPFIGGRGVSIPSCVAEIGESVAHLGKTPDGVCTRRTWLGVQAGHSSPARSIRFSRSAAVELGVTESEHREEIQVFGN
jgi:hypothetical protein